MPDPGRERDADPPVRETVPMFSRLFLRATCTV